MTRDFSPGLHARRAALAAAVLLAASPAFAQMLQRPWTFSQTNRASIAFSLRGNGAPGAVGVAPGTSILCGGGSSTAAGNSTCIVLNNADGTVVIDQVSEGSQDAANTQMSEIDGASSSGVDEVLSILGAEE